MLKDVSVLAAVDVARFVVILDIVAMIEPDKVLAGLMVKEN
jgi:hypothetical protein